MNEWITYLLGGGLTASLLAIFTLNAKIRKAAAEAESVSIANTEKATQILITNIVTPLQSELYDTRQQIRLLRKAINAVSVCAYRNHCPVVRELQKSRADTEDNKPLSGGEGGNTADASAGLGNGGAENRNF